ncbi:MAG: hypothetical protein P8Q14_10920 [Vicingaceae bacterium]|nr:hypothetical protein [Vicingaceae bacterium]
MALHLTFDSIFETEKRKHEKFKEMKLSEQFISYDREGIPCYALDLGFDSEESANLITDILFDLYDFESEQNYQIELLDQSQN